jgi:hypothetical protein
MSTDESKKAEAAAADLESEQLDKVSGGLNPQPLPPGKRPEEDFSGPSGTGKLAL